MANGWLFSIVGVLVPVANVAASVHCEDVIGVVVVIVGKEAAVVTVVVVGAVTMVTVRNGVLLTRLMRMVQLTAEGAWQSSGSGH